MTDEELKTTMFEYLDDLRESGVTNMWGAPVYLMQEYGLNSRQARDIVTEWMRGK